MKNNDFNKVLDTIDFSLNLERLNNLHKEDFCIRVISMQDEADFVKQGFNAGRFGKSEASYYVSKPLENHNRGYAHCFVVESRILKKVICAFCIRERNTDTGKWIEIWHFAKEHSFNKHMARLGYYYYGKLLFERFAIPIAKFYCRKLGIERYYALVSDNNVLKHMTSANIKKLSVRQTIKLKRQVGEKSSKLVLFGLIQ